MSQAFTRWPSPASPLQRKDSSPERLPPWMLAERGRTVSISARDVASTIVISLAPLTVASLMLFDGGSPLLVWSAAAIFTCLASFHLLHVQSSLYANKQGFAAAFERAGVCMWREDWTAAGDAVAALRRAGVADIEGYFADHPEELRAICGKVMIRDVNACTLSETGAPDKAAYLGPLDRLLPPTDQTFVQWLVAFGRGDRMFRSEAHIERADGTVIDTLFAASLPQNRHEFSDLVVTSIDISSYKRAQELKVEGETEFARATSAASVGALSASIAHEVNTPLAAVAANAQAALRWLKRDQPNVAEAIAALDDVVTQASRARDVVARTRSLLGKAPLEPKQIDVVHAARDATLFAERELRANGAVAMITAGADVPPALGDLVQIQQVFVNLLVNAAQAMASCPGPRDISIAVRAGDDSVHAIVSDRGPGIEPDQRERMFEPLQSTKPGGMGMGLAICRNVVEAHGGKIWISESSSGGAAFHFTLPAHSSAR